jgi:hypothetical protein
MLSLGTKKRLSRIRRRATQEVRAAFEAGKISARRADTLLYLEPKEQLAELEHLLAVREDARRRSKIAAEIIRRHLALGQRDLQKLRQDLKTALIKTHA